MKTVLSSAKIYLEDRREHQETDSWRISTTRLNPVPATGPQTISEYTLAPSYAYGLAPETAGQYLIIPLVGGLQIQQGHLEPRSFVPGEYCSLVLGAGESLTLANRYTDGLINFLVIRSAPPAEAGHSGAFDLEHGLNQLEELERIGAYRAWIGKYGGRQEGQLDLPADHLFFYVLEGAFEAAERLLENKDGLQLTGAQAAEWEALSNNAILLLLSY